MKNNSNHSFYIDQRSDSLTLNGLWNFDFAPTIKEAKQNGFRYETELPCSVYKSIEKAGLLQPYYFGDNSKLYRDLRNQCFVYKRSFFAPEDRRGKQAFLCFDGADYETSVYINGKNLGTHFGVCAGPYIRVEDYLKYGDVENTIVIETKSAALSDRNFEPWNDSLKNKAILPWGLAGDNRCGNGNFFLQGINGDIRLEFVNPVHLSRPFLYTVSASKKRAALHFSAELTRESLDETKIERGYDDDFCSLSRSNFGTIPYDRNKKYRIEIIMHSSDGKKTEKTFSVSPYDMSKFDEKSVFEECQYIEQDFYVENPVLWWPSNMGEPHLYDVTVRLLDNGTILDSHSFLYGIRTLSWEYTSAKKQYYDLQPYQLVVNGKRQFMRGINTIPFDYLLDRDEGRKTQLLEMVKEAHIGMIRVWGAAGVYASDSFFNLCDRLGILVWQDSFTGNVPCPKWDVKVTATLVSANVYRIRKHTSLAAYCGGNEINPYAPGIAAVLGVIRRTTERLDDTRRFFDTTPLGGSAHIYIDTEPTRFRKSYRDLPLLAESGVHCFPSFASLKKDIPKTEQSGGVDGLSVLWQENHPGLMCHFVENNAERVPQLLKRTKQITDVRKSNLEKICISSQLAAAEYYQIMCEAMSENYPHTAGVLLWVLTRAWNTIGAQLIDRSTQGLLPYYAVKNAFAPINPRVSLNEISYAPGEKIRLVGTIINYSGLPFGSIKLEITVYGMTFEKLFYAEREVDVTKYCAQIEFDSFALPKDMTDGFWFIFIRAVTEDGTKIDRIYRPKCIADFENGEKLKLYRRGHQPNFDWEGKVPLDEQLCNFKTNLTLMPDNNAIVIINAGGYPAYPVIIESADDKPVYPKDNGFFLPGGESRRIEFISKSASAVKISGFNFETQVVTGVN